MTRRSFTRADREAAICALEWSAITLEPIGRWFIGREPWMGPGWHLALDAKYAVGLVLPFPVTPSDEISLEAAGLLRRCWNPGDPVRRIR